MPRQATKAVGNVYYNARIRASKYNENFLTRVGASEYLPGVTEDSIKKYELGITRPPNDVVVLMADAYNAPDLLDWYCENECPFGKCRSIPEMPAERALIRLQNSVGDIENATKQISLIMDDGVISEDETPIVIELEKRLEEAKHRIEETLVALKRAENMGRFE